MESFSHGITKHSLGKYLLFPDEVLVVAKRRHYMLLLGPVVTVFFIGSLLIAALIFFALLSPKFMLLYTAAIASCIALMGIFFVKIFTEWYFRLYIVTSRRILDISLKPLTSHAKNEVLLDQVRCTEVDVRTDGIIGELLDCGDITITFDRPTHQELFTFTNIHHPEKVAESLIVALETVKVASSPQLIWQKNTATDRMFPLTEELSFEHTIFHGMGAQTV